MHRHLHKARGRRDKAEAPKPARERSSSRPRPKAPNLTVVLGVNNDELKPSHRGPCSNTVSRRSCLGPRRLCIAPGDRHRAQLYRRRSTPIPAIRTCRIRCTAICRTGGGDVADPTDRGGAGGRAPCCQALKGRPRSASRPRTCCRLCGAFRRGARHRQSQFADGGGGELEPLQALSASTAPSVSVDFNRNSHSSTLDLTQTQVLNKKSSVRICLVRTTNGASRTAWSRSRRCSARWIESGILSRDRERRPPHNPPLRGRAGWGHLAACEAPTLAAKIRPFVL